MKNSLSAMRKRSPHPRLLNEVMEAIAKLKELEGSTPKTISNQVEVILNSKRTQLQRDAGHIAKALKHGVLSGLITRTKGRRYKLGMAKKDYDAFKNLTPMVRDGEFFREHRRRGRRGGKKRRRRRSRRGRRRRSDWEEEDSDDNYSEASIDTASPLGTPIPEDRGRRRRKKGRRRGRRRSGRRGRRHAVEDDQKKTEKTSVEDKKQPKKVVQKSSNDSMKSTESQNQYDGNKDGVDQDPDDIMDDDFEEGEANVNCDSPDCLCNIMQPEENTQENRKMK